MCALSADTTDTDRFTEFCGKNGNVSAVGVSADADDARDDDGREPGDEGDP